jgi:hypothetical protein
LGAFSTVGGGVLGGVVLGGVVVLGEVVVLGDVVVPGAVVVLGEVVLVVGVLVAGAELVEWVLEPHAARIPMLAVRATTRVVVDTRRAALRRGRCERGVTVQSVSSAPSPVIGREEDLRVPRAT